MRLDFMTLWRGCSGSDIEGFPFFGCRKLKELKEKKSLTAGSSESSVQKHVFLISFILYQTYFGSLICQDMELSYKEYCKKRAIWLTKSFRGPPEESPSGRSNGGSQVGLLLKFVFGQLSAGFEPFLTARNEHQQLLADVGPWRTHCGCLFRCVWVFLVGGQFNAAHVDRTPLLSDSDREGQKPDADNKKSWAYHPF